MPTYPYVLDSLDDQPVPGTFAHAVHHLVDGLDLSDFDAHSRNDVNGAPVVSPARLLKAVLLGYSQGMVSSRAIERAYRDHVLFIAITVDISTSRLLRTSSVARATRSHRGSRKCWRSWERRD